MTLYANGPVITSIEALKLLPVDTTVIDEFGNIWSSVPSKCEHHAWLGFGGFTDAADVVEFGSVVVVWTP